MHQNIHLSPACLLLPALLPCSCSQLTDAHIAALPIPRLQKNGLLFVWVRCRGGWLTFSRCLFYLC